MGDSIGSRLLNAQGLAMGLSVLSLLVALPAQGGGGWSKAVADYLYPPPVHSLLNRVHSRSASPVLGDEPVNIPSASPGVNDSAKEGGRKITSLANELQVNILANLPIRDLLACKQVCKHWQTLVTTVPALACAAYRSCHPAGYGLGLDDTVNTYHESLRQWLNSLSQQGSKAVTRLDGILASGGPHFPEQLFFAVANVLEDVQAFDCHKVCTVKHLGLIYSPCFSPDEQYLITNSAHTIKICRCIDGQWQDVDTLSQSAQIMSFRFSPDSRHFVVALDNDDVKIWQLADGQWQQADLSPASLRGHPVFNGDTTYLVIVSKYNNTQIYRLMDGQWQLQASALDNHPVWGACFHPKEHNLLATYCYNTITLWRCLAGQWQDEGTLPCTSKVFDIQFSPDGHRLMAHSGDPGWPGFDPKLGIHIWHRVGSKWQKEAVLPIAHLGHLAHFSPSGHYIFNNPDTMPMGIWRLSGSQWKNLEASLSENCFSGCFSPDECNLATQGWMNRAIVWRDRHGQLAQEAVIPCMPRPRISFSPHGNHLLTIANLETAMIWGIFNGRWQEKAVLTHTAELATICFSPQGRYVLTTTWGGTVTIWSLNSQQ